jgi:hypothetical protein
LNKVVITLGVFWLSIDGVHHSEAS